MSTRALIIRETAVSVLINTVLSVLFFLLVFGMTNPVQLAAFGRDFLPQSFMIALMGTLVPSLILRKRTGAGTRSVILRALAFVAGATAIGGGASFAVCALLGGELDAMTGLAVKAAYGAALAAIVTPLALGAQFKASQETL